MKSYVTITRVKNQKIINEIRKEEQDNVVGGGNGTGFPLYGVPGC